MACTYVKDFKFDSDKGFTGSAKKYAEGGKIDMAQDKAMIKKAISMHDKQEHKGKHTDLCELKKGGAMHKMPDGSMMAGEKHSMKKEELISKKVQRGPAMVAGRDPRTPMIAPAMKCGGKVYKK